MPTEAHKKATLKWDRENMTNLCIKIRRDYADKIRAKCRARGTTPSKIMRAAIDAFMDDDAPAPADDANKTE